MDLFNTDAAADSPERPLADRMRPRSLSDFIGQEHLVGEGQILTRLVGGGSSASIIFWGPPGVGKTTLAGILANELAAAFFAISAVTSGLADVRRIMHQARVNRSAHDKRTILFIDEIHRFNKAQQDALLHAVEDGTVSLIGATTENPSFEVIAPLLSRCRVFRLEKLENRHLERILDRALELDPVLREANPVISDSVRESIVHMAAGDGRAVLNLLEFCVQLSEQKDGRTVIDDATVEEALKKQSFIYDKKGDAHYDTISAFIKTVRGSDPDGALYWLARMLQAGEDPLFIARRLVVLASEDIGNAAPTALVLAQAAFQAVHSIGMPEARIILAQATTYLASAPKSNASYQGVSEALADAAETSSEPVPLHLRNAPTGLMKEFGHGEGYKYAHDFAGGFVEQQGLPDTLNEKVYYRPKDAGAEAQIKQRLEQWWKKRRT
ncbi:replication-associated recombination protein A [bacterium]|nr:replication-associated recombination protein A [bacterium]